MKQKLRRNLLLLVGILFTLRVSAAVPVSIKELRAHLYTIGALSGTAKTDSLNALINRLKAAQKIPFTTTDSVVFIVRATSGTVQIQGDHTSWGSAGSVPSSATKFPNVDVYLLALNLPGDAKSDYKVVLGGTNWILDPLNPRTQNGGFGANSTFWMPGYIPSTEMIVNPLVPKGTVSAAIQDTILALSTLPSTFYRIQFRVYTPPGYERLSNLPVVYFTDGQEYADPNLGAVPTVLDNKIASGELTPLIAVFIDPRNPASLGTNRRQTELVKNAAYTDFIANELIPRIDALYKTDPRPEKRVVAGTSLGGLHATYFATRHSRIVGNYLIHSPAYWVALDVVNTWQNEAKYPAKVFLSYGTLFDGTENARLFKGILESKGYDFLSIERSEGHSWGQWRTLIDEPLIYFFGGVQTSNEKQEKPSDFSLSAFPNPFNPSVSISFSVPKAGIHFWEVADLTGKVVARSSSSQVFSTGNQTLHLDLSGASSGVYLFRISGPAGTATKKITLLK